MKTVHVRGADLAFHEEGSGLPLLLVHGFPLTHAMWSEQIRALAPRCRVIAPDLRGFGASRVTAGRYRRYSSSSAALPRGPPASARPTSTDSLTRPSRSRSWGRAGASGSCRAALFVAGVMDV